MGQSPSHLYSEHRHTMAMLPLLLGVWLACSGYSPVGAIGHSKLTNVERSHLKTHHLSHENKMIYIPLPEQIRRNIPKHHPRHSQEMSPKVQSVTHEIKAVMGNALPDSCPSDMCPCSAADTGWFLPYPCNCHWYYQCLKDGNNWNPKMFDCGEWVFDPHQEACIWPELAPPEMCDVPDICKGCPLPCQTMQNGACYPECCEDPDCSGGLCDSGGACQLGNCRKGSDCTGYNTKCHEPWQTGNDNCEYCDNMDTQQEIGSCKPGCENTLHDMCPSDFSCAGQHNCVSGGSTLLRKIHLATESCQGCSNVANNEGGAKIHVIATRQECTTGNLDHEAVMDYSAGNTAVFESGPDIDDMAECNNAEVAGGPKSVEITWNGSGTWNPSQVKLEVSGGYFYACTPLTPISQDQTATLTCIDML